MSTTTPIRVLVVDDIPVVRNALVDTLDADPRFEVVGACADGATALDCASGHPVDVTLLDLDLPDMGGMALLDRLKTRCHACRAIVYTSCERPSQVLASMAGGANGYITKRQTMNEITDALLAVAEGGTVISPSLAGHLIDANLEQSRTLTEHELEVLRKVADGATDAQIGRELFVSTRTVQNVLGKIREKTGTRRRSELAKWAVQHAWI